MSHRNETVWRKPCPVRMSLWRAASEAGGHRGRVLACLAIIGLVVAVPAGASGTPTHSCGYVHVPQLRSAGYRRERMVIAQRQLSCAAGRVTVSGYYNSRVKCQGSGCFRAVGSLNCGGGRSSLLGGVALICDLLDHSSTVVLELEVPRLPPPPSESMSATAARQAPRLGRPWAPDQVGYGSVRPSHIFNGGDPTGEMQHIHWTGWGSRQAVGEGDAEYVWPGTSVASNGDTSGARVVAFHLGTCRGRPSYNAIEWYFPKYGQSFNPHSYINICTGKYVGYDPPETECPDVKLADGGMATEVRAISMTCPAASTIIAETNTTKFGTGEGRFMQAGFRCGTGGGPSNALFDCEMGQQEFLFWAKP